MIKSIFIILIGFFFSNLAFSEGGNVYLKHYNHTCKDADNYNFWIKEEKSGIMIFANSKGILSYDGIQWHLMKTEHTPLSIEADKRSGKVYAGFRNDFGYFIRNEKGNFEYTSLSKKFKLSGIGEIVRIFITDTTIFFCNSHHVYQIDSASEILLRKIEGDYSGYAIYKNQFLVNLNGKGLHKLSSGNFIPIKSGNVFANEELLFGISTEENKVLLGTSSDDLYYYNGKELYKFNSEAETYIHQHILSDAVSINEKEVIIGTLAGGCVILNKMTGKINDFVTIRTGLPDNEVIALGKDKNGGIWISHNYGFSRIDQFLPFKEYTYYQGLEGNLVSVLSHKNSLYISTSDGVFNFKKIRQNENVYARQNKQSNSNHSKKEFPILFENIFTRKRLKRNEKVVDHYQTPSKFQAGVNKKKISEIDEYRFEKVTGIDAKCKSLLPFSQGILATTAQGLFEIKGNKAKPILKETYINCIIPTDKSDCFLLGTKNGLYYTEFCNNKWKVSIILKDHFNAYSLTTTKTNRIWIGSSGKIIGLKINSSNEILEKKIYYLDNFYNENILTRTIHGRTCFFTSSDVYYYNSQKDTILKDLTWSYSNGNFTFSSNQVNLTWHHTDSTWTGLDSYNQNKKLSLSYLSFFNHPRDIFMDDQKNIWIIDETNRLFKFESQKMIDLKNFQVHLQSVRTDNGHVLPLNDINLDYKSNSLHFSMAAPFYFDEKSIQFQYYLEGMTSGWSSWTKDHKIEFTYLPSGDYKLHIRAKNGLGQFSEVQQVGFKILPPYWKTKWFFVSEILFFMSLMIISTLMNQNHESNFFTKVMTFLTLIILIEFLVYQIESIFPAGNADNPIIRFGFNVMLALLISPIEKILEVVISKKKRRIAKIMLMWRRKSGLIKSNA